MEIMGVDRPDRTCDNCLRNGEKVKALSSWIFVFKHVGVDWKNQNEVVDTRYHSKQDQWKGP